MEGEYSQLADLRLARDVMGGAREFLLEAQ
jgi:hypothetical protein